MAAGSMTQFYVGSMSTFQVWRVDGDKITHLTDVEQRKLFTGDCYIVQYTYPGSGRDENIIYSWLGRRSVMVRMTYRHVHCKYFLYKFTLFS